MTLVFATAGLLAAPLLAVNAFVYLVRWHVERRAADPAEPLPLPTALGGFLAECGAMAVALVSRLFGVVSAGALPAPPQRGIALLLPDSGLDAASFWLLRRRLRKCGWATYPGPVGGWARDAAGAAAIFHARVQELRARAPQAVFVLIAHGSGGILARDYLRRHPDAPIRRLITLGTPHQGTCTPWMCGALRRLRPGSSLIEQLAAGDPVPEQFDATAISSPFDAWTLPTAAAYYPGAFNIEIRGIGHYALLTSRRVAQLLMEQLPDAAPNHAARR